MSFILRKKARDDLKKIAQYTLRNWGKRQRNQYLKEIDETFRKIGNKELYGTSCDDIRKGYLKVHIGSHIVFYRYIKHEAQIIRILHNRMDVKVHIQE